MASPLLRIVTTVVLLDDHVARLVTLAVVPSLIVAVAVYWLVKPSEGALPVTASVVSVGAAGGVGVGVEPPHAENSRPAHATIDWNRFIETCAEARNTPQRS